jgi:hypothetical protein
MNDYGWCTTQPYFYEVLNLPKEGDIIEILDYSKCVVYDEKHKKAENNKPYRISKISQNFSKHIIATLENGVSIVLCSFAGGFIDKYQKYWKISSLSGGRDIPYASSFTLKLEKNPCGEIVLDMTPSAKGKSLSFSDDLLIISQKNKTEYDVKLENKSSRVNIPITPIAKKKIMDIQVKKTCGVQI